MKKDTSHIKPDEYVTGELYLSGKKAIQLWQCGREAWNEWVSHNPKCDISFETEDLSEYSPLTQQGLGGPDGVITNFDGYCFPKGRVSFGGQGFREMRASEELSLVTAM